jgi:hypothetical protein
MKYFLIFLILTFGFLNSCKAIKGSGKIVEKEFNVSDIEEVELSGSGIVYISFGETEKLTVKGDDNIIEALDIKVKDNVLKLGKYKNNFVSISPTREIEYRLTLKNLEGISVSGSGNIKCEPFSSREMEISISGSGNVALENLKSEDLEVSISGSGSCEIGGTVNKQEISISGSGEFHGKDLISQNAECNISGSGEAYLYVEEFIESHVSGSGDIFLWGPAQRDIHTSGSGDVIYKGE